MVGGALERRCNRGGMCGGVLSLCSGQSIEQQKKSKIRGAEPSGLRWPPINNQLENATTNRKTVSVVGGIVWDEMLLWWNVWGWQYHLVWPSNWSTKINEGKKYIVALGGHQTTNKNTTTNQKHAGSMGERWDMMRNRRGARWEHELNVLGWSSWDSVKN
jgi:hypothetical protein